MTYNVIDDLISLLDSLNSPDKKIDKINTVFEFDFMIFQIMIKINMIFIKKYFL